MRQASAADPWSIYWQADNLNSCIATSAKQDIEKIAGIWQDFAAGLELGAAVLDLATGNGTVPLALLQGNNSLRITAVDRAQIDPLRFLSSPGLLEGVNFIADVDICSMPFGASTFDAITSQFGIEYSAMDDAIDSAASVLKSTGQMHLLLHHADSEIVVPTRLKLREMKSLLQADGVIERLMAYVRGAEAISGLDNACERHFVSGVGHSSQISGQIFEGVRRVKQSIQHGDHLTSAKLASAMSVRLRADHDRLTQLNDVALTEDQVRTVGDRLEIAGVSVNLLQPLVIGKDTADEALVGWQVRGEKR